MFGQVALAHAGLAVKPVQRRLGGDADKVAIAFFIFGKNEQVVVIVALRGGPMVLIFADVEFAAEDRFDALFFGGVEEVDSSINVAVISHRDRLLAEGGYAVNELFNVTGAVEKGIFRMQMEVGEFGHGYY